MKIVNKALVDLDEAPLKVQTHPNIPPAEDAPLLTVSRVLLNAALTPSQGQPYSADLNAERYTLAITLHKAKEGDDLEVSSGLAQALTADICRLYGPLVAGQVVPLLK